MISKINMSNAKSLNRYVENGWLLSSNGHLIEPKPNHSNNGKVEYASTLQVPAETAYNKHLTPDRIVF